MLIANILKKHSQTLKAALPKSVPYARFVRAAVSLSREQDDIFDKCLPTSLLRALEKSAADGLLPDGEEAFIKIESRVMGSHTKFVARYIPMIKGVIKRIKRSEKIISVVVKSVREGDEFNYSMDINGQNLSFVPNSSSAAPFLKFFAVAKIESNGHIETFVEVMDVDQIYKAAKNANALDVSGNFVEGSFWALRYEDMSHKTVLHKLAKLLPLDEGVQIELENEDVDSYLDSFIDDTDAGVESKEETEKLAESKVRNIDAKNPLEGEPSKEERRGRPTKEVVDAARSELIGLAEKTSTDMDRAILFIGATTKSTGKKPKTVEDLNYTQIQATIGYIKQQMEAVAS